MAGKHQVKTWGHRGEAEIGGTLLRAKEPASRQKGGRGEEGFRPEPGMERGPARPWILDVWPPEYISVGLSPPQVVAFCYGGSQRSLWDMRPKSQLQTLPLGTPLD